MLNVVGTIRDVGSSAWNNAMGSVDGIITPGSMNVLNSALLAFVLFFLYRVIKKSDRYGELDTKLQLLQQSVNKDCLSLAREIDKAKMDHEALRDVHQYFGVIKQNQAAVFKRIDEVRSDVKDLNSTVTGEVSSLRKDYYELKSKVDSHPHI